MSLNLKSNYDSYVINPHIQPKKPNLRVIPHKQKKKKLNLAKILLLSLLLYFVIVPSCKNIYNYTFFNRLHNSKITYNVEDYVNPAQSLLYNANLFGRNYVAKVETINPQMAQLRLENQMETLKYNLETLINQYPKLEAGVFVWDYMSNDYVDINADKQFSAASIIKVPILLQMFKKIESGNLDLYEKFDMTSYYRSSGSGTLQYSPDGTEFELETLAKHMIRTSDNSATNMILSAVGGSQEMDMALRNWGFSKTYVKNWLPDLYGTNVTTPKDMATILYNSDNPDFLSLENRSRIVEIMSKVKNTSLLKQGIPDDAQLIHKTGDIGEMLGDVGVVTMPDGRRYIITVMVKRNWNDYSARSLINNISSMVYNSFATNNL